MESEARMAALDEELSVAGSSESGASEASQVAPLPDSAPVDDLDEIRSELSIASPPSTVWDNPDKVARARREVAASMAGAFRQQASLQRATTRDADPDSARGAPTRNVAARRWNVAFKVMRGAHQAQRLANISATPA